MKEDLKPEGFLQAPDSTVRIATFQQALRAVISSCVALGAAATEMARDLAHIALVQKEFERIAREVHNEQRREAGRDPSI